MKIERNRIRAGQAEPGGSACNLEAVGSLPERFGDCAARVHDLSASYPASASVFSGGALELPSGASRTADGFLSVAFDVEQQARLDHPEISRLHRDPGRDRTVDT